MQATALSGALFASLDSETMRAALVKIRAGEFNPVTFLNSYFVVFMEAGALILSTDT